MKSISQDKNQYIKRTKLKVQNEKYNKRKEEKSRTSEERVIKRPPGKNQGRNRMTSQ